MIWVAVGGRGTLVGAALGAVVVNFAKTYFTGAFPEYWLFALGALFVLVTLFLPKGMLGWFASLRRGPPPAPPPASLARQAATPSEEGARNDRAPTIPS